LGAVRYFEDLGFRYDPQENVADYLIDTVARTTVASQDLDFAQAFAASKHAEANDRGVSDALRAVLMRRYEVESEQLAAVPTLIWKVLEPPSRHVSTKLCALGPSS
jgi:hypothetical protein